MDDPQELEMQFEICRFGIPLYDDVLELWRQCEGIGLSDADSPENIKAYLDRNPGMSYVAMAGGKIVGAILGGHDGRRGYIHHLAVASEYRRQGLGRQLVERCISALASVGIRKCHIFIFNTNMNGIAFWQAAGWLVRQDVQLISKNIRIGGE
jgi:putative acetyltransferase